MFAYNSTINYIMYFLPLRLTPFVVQPDSFCKGFVFEVMTTKYCISLQVRLLFASRAKAQRPAAIGAEAEVPSVWKFIWLF